MEPLLKADLPQYFVLEGPSPTLQVILAPGQSIKTDLRLISYLSKSLSVKQLKRPWSTLCRPVPSLLSLHVKNKSGAIEYVGLASPLRYQILVINPEVLREEVIVQESRLLAVTNEVAIQEYV
jgi:uncharacterized protein (AIM24 family)